MDAFLDRFYDEVDDNLNDPHISKRLTKAKKFSLLKAVEKRIWERILTGTGQESMAGYTETTITLKDDQEYYLLPGNFRQFLDFEKRLNSNPNLIQNRMVSIHHYDPGPGIEILEGRRGFRVKPRPTLNENQDWTLLYLKGPVVIHHAQAQEVGDSWLKGQTPETDDGELINIDDYYNGCLLRVFSAASGAPQTREITDYDATNKVFHFRHDWVPKPTGTVMYEISPLIPEDYDSIYALDVAMWVLGRRVESSRRRELLEERNELWNACRNYFLSNVADRGPTRMIPVRPNEPDTGYDPSWL